MSKFPHVDLYHLQVGKESMVPQELGVTVETLKAFVKEEKDVSSEVLGGLQGTDVYIIVIVTCVL